MFRCLVCGNTGCVIDPPNREGVLTCTKCGQKHGRFSAVYPREPSPANAQQPNSAPKAPSAAAATVIAQPLRAAAAGEPPAQRLLRRAPADWRPVPDYASLTSAKCALAYLQQAGLVELRFTGVPPNLVWHWRLTDAGRKAAAGM